MLRPRQLTLSGFRGIAAPRTLQLDNPLTVFFGENHEGKSSVVNGVEWGLFGDECAGK